MTRLLRFALAAWLALSPIVADAAQNSVVTPTSGPHTMADFAGNYLNPALQTLLTESSGSTAPANPAQFQPWFDSSTSPATLRYYDGANWVAVATLNAATHAWAMMGSGAALTGLNASSLASGTVPVATLPAFGGGDITCPAGSVVCAVAKIGGLVPAPSATKDATNANNITSGTLPIAQLPTGVPDVPIVPGLSTSTNSYTCTQASTGNGFLTCPANDFIAGNGVLVPGQGATWQSWNYSAPTPGAAVTGFPTQSADTKVRCYVLVSIDGRQGYSTPTAEKCSTASTPATTLPTDYVNFSWINGSNPPPAYAIYEGPSGGPYQIQVRALTAGAGNSQMIADYGRVVPAPDPWLPATLTAPLSNYSSQNDAAVGIASFASTFINVGTGLPATTGTSVKIYHDNGYPIRLAAYYQPVGGCVRVPLGTFPVYPYNNSGSLISMTSQCLKGSDRYASKILLMGGVYGAPLIAAQGTMPAVTDLAIDGGGFDSDGSIDVSFGSGSIAPRLNNVSFQRVQPHGFAWASNSTLRGEFSSFDCTGVADFANYTACFNDSHSLFLTVRDFKLINIGGDLSSSHADIENGYCSGTVSACLGSEIDPFANSIRFDHISGSTSNVPNSDINGTYSELIEKWDPDGSITNSTCDYAYGTCFSIGGMRSAIIGNTAKSVGALPAFQLSTTTTASFATGSTSITVASASGVLAGYAIQSGSSGIVGGSTIARSYTAGSLTIPLSQPLSAPITNGQTVTVNYAEAAFSLRYDVSSNNAEGSMLSNDTAYGAPYAVGVVNAPNGTQAHVFFGSANNLSGTLAKYGVLTGAESFALRTAAPQ